MTDEADWLAGLVVGDPVVVNWSGEQIIRRVMLVERTTDTLIVTDERLRFRRKDGHPPGDFGWTNPWITKPTALQARKAAR